MRFTFTGETGEAGFARLAPDAEPADVDAYLASRGGTPPVLVPSEDHDPSAHAWMLGSWIPVHRVGPGGTHEVTTPVTEEGDTQPSASATPTAAPRPSGPRGT